MSRIVFFQRDSGGAPLTGVTFTGFTRYVDDTLGPLPTFTEINATYAPGWYYFDVTATKDAVVTTDAGAGVTDDGYRYQGHFIDVSSDPAQALAIADAVWDEALSGHLTAGTAGKTLSSVPDATTIEAAVWDAATGDHVISGSMGEAIVAPPDAAAIADAVWDEPTAGHVASGSTGEALAAPPDAATIADAVWDEATSGHVIAGSTGEAVAAPPTAAAIADAVWDEATAGHVASGSTGEALLAPPSMTDIAGAVWDEATTDHVDSGTFGLLAAKLIAHAGESYRVTSVTYSGTPSRPTSTTIKLYPTKADADADTNALETLTVTRAYDSLGRPTTVKMTPSA